jgi:putative chitinase
MTGEELARVCGATVADASKYARHLWDARIHFHIMGPKRTAMFLAQIAFESQRFSRVEENMSYSAKRLMAVWPRRFPTIEFAQQYAHNPQKLANFVYGGRMGNTAPNDGWKYRGRGLKQLTGCDNYTLATKDLLPILGVNYVQNPDAVAQPVHAAWTAAWFWSVNGLNSIADSGNYERVTRIINGGLIGHEDGNAVGMDDRVEYFEHVQAKLEQFGGVLA